MDVLEALLPFVLIVLLILGAKAVWMSGFVAGTLGEARLWLEGIDKLMKPNWQSLPVSGGDDLSPEQVKWLNQIYVQAYELALHTIKAEIAEARRSVVEKAKAEEERQARRFGA
jgi:hypothetical protein